MIDSYIASFGRYSYNIICRLWTYSAKLAMSIFVQVMAVHL